MTDQAEARKLLSALAKREDLENRVCADCSNPNPQWASLGFAVLVCLQCAGTHRGFGVHISFVRSISMDTWQDEQLRRMQLGGNKPFKDFMNSYQDGGYRPDSSPHEKYHSWAAAQYKEKLDAMLAGREWSPSPAPPGYGANSRSASPAPSAAGLRKSRASGRSGLGSVARSSSQTPSIGSGSSTPVTDQKSRNENYFATLGRTNDSRPEDLPPSQGGKYSGFGSTPTPAAPQHDSFALSSANAPTLTELQENPVAALSKGWSLFAAAVGGAAKVVSENVIQPGVEKVTDPNFQATVRGYMTEAQKKAAMVGSSANEWSKHSFGVDVADTVGGVARTMGGGAPSRQGYGQLSMTSPNEFGDTSGRYDTPDDDFFSSFDSPPSQQQAPTSNLGTSAVGSSAISRSASSTGSVTKAKKAPAKKEDDWDDWKDF
ncbi:ArfGap-domain-containing protein [Coprinopsis sp. MPI-PUGE-AT-0042]|nr:ArfGap-domain-containing protein [Coprinopsis sp. MPI-PUGE-AT-0042]